MEARRTWREGPFTGGLEGYVKVGSVIRRLHKGPVGEPGRGFFYVGPSQAVKARFVNGAPDSMGSL